MNGAVPSWHSAQLTKHSDNFTSTLLWFLFEKVG